MPERMVINIATIIIPKQIPPTTINVFLGLNESSDGDTELKLGEASKMLNWRITDAMKLKKMEGYSPLFASLGAGVIQGQWKGTVGGTFYHLFAHGGNIYKRIASINTIIGTMTDAKTSFFFFSGKVYIINGHEYKSWDGTTFQDVAGYRPLIVIDAPPGGGVGSVDGDGLGRLFEEINNLTGQKHQTFSPDGVKTVFQLAETNIGSVDFVKIAGVLKTLATDYTIDLVTGKITFTVVPSGGVPGSVDIGWTKGTGDRASVYSNQYAMLYGGGVDSRVLMWGNPTAKNRFCYSALSDGVLSAEYFPAGNFSDVGSDQHAITDITRQFDRIAIFTEVGSYYSMYSTTTLVSTQVVVNFPIYELNSAKGNVAPGQVQLIKNDPFTIQEGVYQWASTNVRDERNAVYMSKRVQPSLDGADLTSAVTFDYEKNGEWWCVVGSTAWIYNYRVDVWYQRSNVAASNFIEIDGELYFGTEGTIMKFDPGLVTDNGTIINAIWEMGFFDFGASWLNKYMNNIYISLKPAVKASIDIATITNNDGGAVSANLTLQFNLATFMRCDFNHFFFNTSYNPQPFNVEIQAMGFCFFKLIISNTSDDVATVLNITLPARMGGKVQ